MTRLRTGDLTVLEARQKIRSPLTAQARRRPNAARWTLDEPNADAVTGREFGRLLAGAVSGE
ncbi:hypothetical protein, partial [Streptomyces muensis]